MPKVTIKKFCEAYKRAGTFEDGTFYKVMLVIMGCSLLGGIGIFIYLTISLVLTNL